MEMTQPSARNVLESDEIRRVLEQSPEPLKAAALSKLLKQKSSKALKPALEAGIGAGRIYAWGSERYLDRNPGVLARERLLRLAASEVSTKDRLNKRAAAEVIKISLNVVRQVSDELLRQGLLRETLPPRGTRGRTKTIVNVQQPEAYLEGEIARLLLDFGIERSREQIRALLASSQEQPQKPPEAVVREIAEKMFSAMDRIAFAPGTTVTFFRLRQQPELAHIPKLLFDQAALQLQEDRKAMLAIHDHAARLPTDQQDELVTDGLGTYYVSIYAL